MYTTPEQFLAASKNGFRSTIRSFDSIEQKAFEGFEQFVSLNVNAAKGLSKKAQQQHSN